MVIVEKDVKKIKEKLGLVDELKEDQDLIITKLEGIEDTQKVTAESLERIFELYQAHTEELEKGSEEFKKFREFMIEKKTSNGYTKDDIAWMKEEIVKKASKKALNRFEGKLDDIEGKINSIKNYLFDWTVKEKENSENKLSENQKVIISVALTGLIALGIAYASHLLGGA
ncbi:MAG: hypothetical protein WA125_06305 [Desulfosporosinus sp.]